METSSKFLFVYGSLRSGFQNPMYEYLTQYFQLVGAAQSRGNLFDNGLYPVAVPTTEDSVIEGELYMLNNEDEFSWAMMQLDDYEGLNVEAGDTPLYRRDLTNAYINGHPQLAWVYWFNLSTEGMAPIEATDVLDYLQKKDNT